MSRLAEVWPDDFTVTFSRTECERVGCTNEPKARRPWAFVADSGRVTGVPMAFCADCQAELLRIYALARGDE